MRAGRGRASQVIQFTTEQRGHELVRVCARDRLTARWNDRCSFWDESKSDAILKELVLHEIGLPSVPIGQKTRRTVVLLKLSSRQSRKGCAAQDGYPSTEPGMIRIGAVAARENVSHGDNRRANRSSLFGHQDRAPPGNTVSWRYQLMSEVFH